MNTILFPSSYFDFKKVNEEYLNEYNAAVNNRLFDVILFDYDKFINDDILKTSITPTDIKLTTYRGWMMKPDEYEKLYLALLKRNIKLITTPTSYQTLHIFPNVYPIVKSDTAKTLIYTLEQKPNYNEIITTFNKFIVKDFVKSVKGSDFPKVFDSSISKEDFYKWISVFYKYRGNLFTGGICIKEFLNLKKYDDNTNEYRAFYVNNRLASLTQNSNQPVNAAKPPLELVEKYKNLDSRFYTVDYAELQDGSWKLIETGDGSVSGLAEKQDYDAFYKTLFRLFNYV